MLIRVRPELNVDQALIKTSYGNGYASDTSMLYDELCSRYDKSRRPVEVDFRSLVHWLRLGDQLTHQIHPYPAKLLPHIAHLFVRCKGLSVKGDVVLDPFCGSGTVALETSLAGRRAYCADANPLALLVSRVKTRPYDTSILRSVSEALFRRAKRLKSAPEIEIVNSHLWYAPEKKRALEMLSRAVNEIDDTSCREFFAVCLSNTARRVSNADPAISVPVRLRSKPGLNEAMNRRIAEKMAWIVATDPVDEFARICSANIDRVELTNEISPKREALVEAGNDARRLKRHNGARVGQLPTGTVPLIITSPPYGSAQKYIRSSGLSLNWLQLATPLDLASLEGASIGREHMPQRLRSDFDQKLPRAYEAFLTRVASLNSTRELITRHYLHDMRSALKEMARVVQPGGHIVLVIGNNQVCGELLQNDKFLIDILTRERCMLKLALVDDIKSRGLMTKRNKTASMISQESVLVFEKKAGIQ